jgi:hypothetical protein
MSTLLEQLLSPKKVDDKPSRFSLRIDGAPKTGKTTLALTASSMCPHPSKWDDKNPVELKDLVWVGLEENCLLYAQKRGLVVPNFLDWSSANLGIKELAPAIKALPAAMKQYLDNGCTTIVVDTLSAFESILLRDIVVAPDYQKDMDRVRAYGRVNDMHDMLFDKLRETGMNFIGLVHLDVNQPFGEEGGNSAAAEAMKRQAEKQHDKVEASSVAGVSTAFRAAMRPKAAGRWARLSDGVLVTFAEEKVVRAGTKMMQYKFAASPNEDYAAGGRWDLQGTQEPYLRPHIERIYKNQNGPKT